MLVKIDLNYFGDTGPCQPKDMVMNNMCKIIAENNALNYMPCYRLQNNFIAKINYGKSWNCLRRNFEWRHLLVAIFKTIVFGKTVCSYSKIMPSMLIKKKTEQNYNRIFMFYTHLNIETELLHAVAATTSFSPIIYDTKFILHCWGSYYMKYLFSLSDVFNLSQRFFVWFVAIFNVIIETHITLYLIYQTFHA